MVGCKGSLTVTTTESANGWMPPPRVSAAGATVVLEALVAATEKPRAEPPGTAPAAAKAGAGGVAASEVAA